MSKPKFTPGPWSKEAIFWLLRFGEKHYGPWNDSAEVPELNQGFNMPMQKDTSLIAAATEMYEALKQLVHLHLCEQEGLASGMPTAEQWISAVDEAARVLRKIEGDENE